MKLSEFLEETYMIIKGYNPEHFKSISSSWLTFSVKWKELQPQHLHTGQPMSSGFWNVCTYSLWAPCEARLRSPRRSWSMWHLLRLCIRTRR